MSFGTRLIRQAVRTSRSRMPSQGPFPMGPKPKLPRHNDVRKGQEKGNFSTQFAVKLTTHSKDRCVVLRPPGVKPGEPDRKTLRADAKQRRWALCRTLILLGLFFDNGGDSRTTFELLHFLTQEMRLFQTPLR